MVPVARRSTQFAAEKLTGHEMEFIKTTGTQLYQSTNPLTRALLILVVMGLIGVVSYTCNRNNEQQKLFLFNGQEFSNSELAKIETALGKAGINEYEIVGQRIEIPHGIRTEIIKAIADSDATPTTVSGLDDANSSFMPFMTSQQQRDLNKAKKQQKICAMIREIEGVEDVLVEYDESRSEGFPKTTHRTAAVTVRSRNGRHLENFEIDTIRATVRRAVAGLNPEEIVVIDGNSAIAHNFDSQNPASNRNSNFITTKKHFEQSCKEKIESVLRCYPGTSINVDIELTKQARAELTSLTHHHANRIATTADNAKIRQVATDHSVPKTLATAGSNGHAKIVAAAKNELVKQASVIVPSRHQHEQLDLEDLLQPKFANVSITVPESLIRRLAARRLAETPRATPIESSDQSQSQQMQRIVTRDDIERCFTSVKHDMMRRVSPMLPGQITPEQAEEFVVISLDPEVEVIATATQKSFDPWQYLSSMNLDPIRDNWHNYAIPAVFVFGFVLLKVGQRSSRKAAEARRRDETERMSADSQREAELRRRESELQRQQLERSEIEHNPIQPNARETRLATDIDRAFEHERESHLSSELMEMAESDPRTTLKVFNDWLKEAS